MARFKIGDCVVNWDLHMRDVPARFGNVIKVHTGHFRGDGYTVQLEMGGTAQWYDDEVEGALPPTQRKQTGAPAPEAPQRKKRFGIF